MDSNMIRIGIGFVGISFMAVSFLMHSYKKMTVNYTVIWELLGFVLLLIGVIPVFSQWTRQLSSGTGLAFSCVGALFLFEEFRTSVTISQLTLKEREIAMHVALLNQENEAILKELDRLRQMLEKVQEGEKEENVEKSSVCCEYAGTRGGGDGASGIVEKTG
ncbi:MAG: DUF2304 family protein [Ruminococcus sp.]|nr:DUF2304 family protein [Ruminococcus sp.]